jgi:D-galactarolactone cycloisomerase
VRLSRGQGPKIQRVRTYALEATLPEAFRAARSRIEKRRVLLVQIVTDDGLSGWGECIGPPAVLQSIIQTVYAPLLLKSAALQTEQIWHNLWQASFLWGRRGIMVAALSGIDMALWDLKGHALKRSVGDMMGGRYFDRVPCYATGLYFRDRPETEMIPTLVEEAISYTEAGYRGVKAQIGRNLSYDGALVKKLREALPDALLMADAGIAYDLPEAMTIGRILEEQGFLWFEDPLSPEFPQQYRHLSERLGVPLAAGEWEQTRWGFQSLLTEGGVSVAQVNLAFCGGLTEALQIRAIAVSHGLNLIPTAAGTMLNLAAALHFSVSGFRQPGRLETSPTALGVIGFRDPLRDDLFSAPVVIEDGTARVPTAPGLGVAIDPDALKRFCVAEQEAGA